MLLINSSENDKLLQIIVYLIIRKNTLQLKLMIYTEKYWLEILDLKNLNITLKQISTKILLII